MAVPVGTAEMSVQGGVTASSVQLDEGLLDARAYLVGFRLASGDESPYRWSFHAEQVEVLLERKHYIGDMTPIHQETTTERALHSDAAGVLLEGLPLAYLMAVSTTPDDVYTTYGLQLHFPFDDLEPRNDVAFSTERLEEDDDTPLQGLTDNRWARSYGHPWNNLRGALHDHHDPLVLHGNFSAFVFDMVFQIRNGTDETTYEAVFGGARGDDIPSPVHEYNNTRAELRFTNASFTFLPAGRPMQVNLLSAGVEATGSVYLTDARGSFNDRTGARNALDGSLVELDAHDLRLDVFAEAETPPRYRLEFQGLVHGAVVDGQQLDLPPAPGPPIEDPAPAAVAARPPSEGGLLSSVAMGATVLLAAALAWWVRRSRSNVDALIEDAKLAMDDGDFTRAKGVLRRILRRDRHNETATVMTARLSLSRNRPHEALDFLEPRVGGRADQHGGVSLAYCAALRDAGDMDEARRVMDELKQRLPKMAGLDKLLPARHDGDMTYA